MKIFISILTITLLLCCVSSKKYKSLQEEMENAKMSLQKCNGNLVNTEETMSNLANENKVLNNEKSKYLKQLEASEATIKIYSQNHFHGEVLNGSSRKWFNEIKTLGNYSVKEALEYSKANDKELFNTIKLESPNTILKDLNKLKDIWKFTGHVVGYIPPTKPGILKSNIKDADLITPEVNLKGNSVKITLDRVITRDYPGSGEHTILIDFYAENQLKDQTESVHFNQLFRSREGEQAGISGYPIFIGLNVGAQGLNFRCFTVNIENKDDKNLVSFLNDDLFKSGLKLLNVVNPITPALSSMVQGFTEKLSKRNSNVPVQDMFLGLDFSDISSRAKLAQGSYVVIQVPKNETWNWDKWEFNKAKNGQVINKVDSSELPLNYFIFSISKM